MVRRYAPGGGIEPLPFIEVANLGLPSGLLKQEPGPGRLAAAPRKGARLQNPAVVTPFCQFVSRRQAGDAGAQDEHPGAIGPPAQCRRFAVDAEAMLMSQASSAANTAEIPLTDANPCRNSRLVRIEGFVAVPTLHRRVPLVGGCKLQLQCYTRKTVQRLWYSLRA